MGDEAAAHLVAEEPIEKVRIERQRALRKDWVAELLKLFEDAVVEAGVVMIGAAEHDDPHAAFALQLVENCAGLSLHGSFEMREGLEANSNGSRVFFAREAEHGRPCSEELVCEDFFVGEVEDGIHVCDAVFSEEVALLGEGGLGGLRCCGDGGAGKGSGEIGQVGGERVVHRKPDGVEWLAGVLRLKQVVDVREGDL